MVASVVSNVNIVNARDVAVLIFALTLEHNAVVVFVFVVVSQLHVDAYLINLHHIVAHEVLHRILLVLQLSKNALAVVKAAIGVFGRAVLVVTFYMIIYVAALKKEDAVVNLQNAIAVNVSQVGPSLLY